MKLFATTLAACLFSTSAFAWHHGPYYRSVDGSMVHVPYHTHSHVRGEMAVCRDGTHSVSHHHRGTCSRHGGVGHWG
jgi:Protein of unknown function (DUF3761)